MSADSKTPSGRSRKSQNPQQGKTLKIEVNKFKSIVDALSGKKWERIMLSVFFVGCILFTGIATIALAIKRMYPYSDITTNGLGATTFKSEKSEVSYWLYNTALFWANSGISVEKGDIITIRCSGKFNTAMHHLYKAAKENTPLEDEWIGPEGVPDDPQNQTGSYFRRKYRIFPGMPTGALVMQVAKNIPFDSPNDSLNKKLQSKPNPDDFYFIGGEREDIFINNPGTLYFGINDIVFNEKTIAGMLIESITDFVEDESGHSKKTQVNQVKRDLDRYKMNPTAPNAMNWLFLAYRTAYEVDFKYLEKDRTKSIDDLEKNEDRILNKARTALSQKNNVKSIILGAVLTGLGEDKSFTLPSRIIESINALSLAIYDEDGENQKEAYQSLIKELRSNRAIGRMRLGVTRTGRDEVVSELETYYNKGDNVYKTAWFDDNVGSFLIVVEKKKR